MKPSRLPGDPFHGTHSSCCWQVQCCPGSKAETFHLQTLPSDAELPRQDCQIIRAFVFLVVTPNQLGAQFLEHELTLPLPSTKAAGPSDT